MGIFSSIKKCINHSFINRMIIIGLIVFVCASHADDNKEYDPTTLVFPSFLHTYGIRKATRFHLFLFTKNKVKFENPQGLAVVRLQAWEDTTTDNDDDEVTVYGVNSGQNNIIYNKSMKSIGVYGPDAVGKEKLNQPHAIAANAHGDVYVSDSGNHRVVKIRNENNELVFSKSTGEFGFGDGFFQTPRGLALDSKNRLYVADRDNHRIQVFSSELDFLDGWTGVNTPDAIAVTDRGQPWTYYGEDFLIVVDSLNSRIRKFSLTGKLLASISAGQMDISLPYFAFVALDYYNNVYVTDTNNHCIHKLNHNLVYLTTYGRKGKGDKEFIEPRGITIYRRFGQVFVAEKHGAQYFWVGTDCFNFNSQPIPAARGVRFKYFLTEPSFVTADIFDTNEKLITRPWTRRFKKSGTQQDIWNGKIYAVPDSVYKKEQVEPAVNLKSLKYIPNGRYKVRYTFEATYSSFHYFEKIVWDEVIIDFQ